MPEIYLGLGSNLGNREKNIKHAIAGLQKKLIDITKISTIIETDPVGGPPQNKFLNAVVHAVTALSPQDLLKTLKSIETDMGRKETVRNGPRIIDIDILLYDRLAVRTPQLIIPHPRMFERDFVMNPLKEIAPQLVEELSHANHHLH